MLRNLLLLSEGSHSPVSIVETCLGPAGLQTIAAFPVEVARAGEDGGMRQDERRLPVCGSRDADGQHSAVFRQVERVCLAVNDIFDYASVHIEFQGVVGMKERHV